MQTVFPAVHQRPAIPTPGTIDVSPIPAVNVACVPQLSPLRYPGGKTWLIPHIRSWLNQIATKPRLLIEPFVGGGIVSLTAVMEDLVDRCLMIEIDRDVAAFWHAALQHGPDLCQKILQFVPTHAQVDAISRSELNHVVEHGFRTLVLNRTRRGGILAPGASFAKAGENGKGIASRWYPTTLVGRIQEIVRYSDRIAFLEGDGAQFLATSLSSDSTDVAVFIDPPYTAAGKKAGKRLYAHNAIDHQHIFELLADSSVDFLMTYDQSPEIIELIDMHGFSAVQVVMKTTHHARIPELVITRHPVFQA